MNFYIFQEKSFQLFNVYIVVFYYSGIMIIKMINITIYFSVIMIMIKGSDYHLNHQPLSSQFAAQIGLVQFDIGLQGKNGKDTGTSKKVCIIQVIKMQLIKSCCYASTRESFDVLCISFWEISIQKRESIDIQKIA